MTQVIYLPLCWVTVCMSFHHLYRDNQKVIICLGLINSMPGMKWASIMKAARKDTIYCQCPMSMTLHWVEASMRISENLQQTAITHFQIPFNVGSTS